MALGKLVLHLGEKIIKEVFEKMSVLSKCLLVKMVGKQHCNYRTQNTFEVAEEMCDKYHQECGSKDTVHISKIHRESLILILC